MPITYLWVVISRLGALLSALVTYDKWSWSRVPPGDPGVVVLRRRHARVLMVHCSVEESGGYPSDEIHPQYPVLERLEFVHRCRRSGCSYGRCVRCDGPKYGLLYPYLMCAI
ncbi:hypothetical protein Trydic_g5457 [Trypoxylus dichotomus]